MRLDENLDLAGFTLHGEFRRDLEIFADGFGDVIQGLGFGVTLRAATRQAGYGDAKALFRSTERDLVNHIVLPQPIYRGGVGWYSPSMPLPLFVTRITKG